MFRSKIIQILLFAALLTLSAGAGVLRYESRSGSAFLMNGDGLGRTEKTQILDPSLSTTRAPQSHLPSAQSLGTGRYLYTGDGALCQGSGYARLCR